MEMKMAATSAITVLLFGCSVFASKDSAGSCDYFAATNNNVIVPLRHKLKSSEQLRWMHNNFKIFDKRPNRLVTGNKDDIDSDGSLRLKNVTQANAGIYTPEVFTEDGKQMGALRSISLCVIDPVLKPKVKIECDSSSVKFTCTVGQAQVNFTWFQNNKLLKKETLQTLRKTTKDVEKDLFICSVSNPVNSMTSEPVTQNCTKPASVFPDIFYEILLKNTWVLVGVGGGVVLVLIIIIIACCIRNRRKKSMQVKDEEELRLGWTNQNQQHQHHQHNCPPDQHPHHHQQHPAGHTGPRQHRSKQQRSQQRPRAPDQPNGQPQPSPRRPAQGHRPVDKVSDDQPPPLPQPRKKAPKTPRV